MGNKKHEYKPHPFRQILKAYGITVGMVAEYLKMSYPYVANMLSGKLKMSLKAQLGMKKLVDRIQNPVFEDDVVTSEGKGKKDTGRRSSASLFFN